MSDYKVGALSDLISGKNNSNEEKPNANLFTTSKKQKDQEPLPQDQEINKSFSSKSKKSKKLNEEEDEKGDEKHGQKYEEPSLKAKVKLEDSKERIVDEDVDKRTIFIGNLPINVAGNKKTLLKLFNKFGKIESVRFRGASKPDLKTTKKTAMIKKTFNPNRHNILAYIKFENESSVLKASKSMNGHELNGNILRVDSANNSGNTAASKDQRKAIFIGNLDLKVKEDDVREHFRNCGGEILDVRLIRDKSTGMGKGFGYVNFKDVDSVENALQLNHSEFHGRKIRVMRSVKKPKKLVPMKVVDSKTKTSKQDNNKKVFRKEVKHTFVGVKTDEKKKKNLKKSKSDLKKKIVAKKLMRS